MIARLKLKKAHKLADLQVAKWMSTRRQKAEIEREREVLRAKLAEVTCVRDEQLLERLIQQGLGPGSVEALRFAPIAEVVWASGYVTDAERELALEVIESGKMLSTEEAVRVFRDWLKSAPSKDLWTTWEQCSSQWLHANDDIDRQRFGQFLHHLATRIAAASGEGEKICSSERAVLHRISRVYQLDPVMS